MTTLSERLLAMPSSLNDACRTMEEAAERIQELEGALQFLFGDTKWKSVDRDNMEFEGRVTCYQLDRARAALTKQEPGA